MSVWSDAAAAIHQALGEQATYTHPGGGAGVPCRVVLYRDSALLGEYGQIIERRTEADILSTEVENPQRGAILAVAGTSYIVRGTAFTDSDSGISRVILNVP